MPRRLITHLMIALMPAMTAFAGGNADSTIWVTNATSAMDSSWVVSFPTGPSDYFNVAHEVVSGIGNSADVVEALPITGLAVSVADFGSGTTYPTVGAFASNLALDSTGSTPDLASPIVAITSPPLAPPPLFDFVTFDTPEGAIPAGATRIHSVVQLPPGDSGLLGVGADSTTSHPGAGTSGFTTSGYTAPSLIVSFIDFGLNPGQDNGATTSCKPADRKPHGRLRASRSVQGTGEGDHLTVTLRAGDSLDLAFFGTKTGDKLRLYASTSPCTPAIGIGPVLSTLADPDGDGSYVRFNAAWPSGFGGQTFRFSAAWGNPACSSPGAGFTNCVTVITLPDLKFGACDDGTIESGWVVGVPGGPSDYFNNDLGDGTTQNGIVGLAISVLDFGVATPAFPTAGVSNANLVVDPSGHSPDLANPLALIAPFTFPPGTFATTSLQYVSHAVAIPGSSLSTHVHAWVQLPQGASSGLLGVGVDSTTINGCSFFTSNGYTTPAVPFGSGNLGLRVTTN